MHTQYPPSKMSKSWSEKKDGNTFNRIGARAATINATASPAGEGDKFRTQKKINMAIYEKINKELCKYKNKEM